MRRPILEYLRRVGAAPLFAAEVDHEPADPLGFELGGCIGDATKRLSYWGQIGFPGGGQDHLPCQPLE